VIALGDSFHDGGGPARVGNEDRATLSALQRGRDWIWIAGNHDPEPVAGLGGMSADTLAIGTLVFRHKPASATATGELAGHLHPVARVSARGRTVSRRCFVGDGARIVMPAFGTYAGGLNVRARAFAHLFGTLSFTAHMLGEGRVYPITAKRCLRD
jgi:DNA ligase-associated metallophosphoesterase